MAWIVLLERRRSSIARPKEVPCSTSSKRSESATKRGGGDAVCYGTKLHGSTKTKAKMTEVRAPSAAMAGYDLLNGRPSEHARVLGTLARSLHQRFGG